MAIRFGEIIVLLRTDPDETFGQLPCPGHNVVYECQINGSSFLRWELPPDTYLSYSGGSTIGVIRNSSDDKYSANLTMLIEDNIEFSEYFLFQSTVLLVKPQNGTVIACSGAAGPDTYIEHAKIYTGGKYKFLCNAMVAFTPKHYIRASVDALCRDGAGLISRERVQRGRLTRQGTTS